MESTLNLLNEEVIMLRVTAAVTKEGNLYVARCLEVEVTSQGKTMEEALENLREALELYLDEEPQIEPFTSPIIAPIDLGTSP